MEGDFKVSLQMGLTHADFFRTLEVFLEGRPHTVTGSRIEIPADGRLVRMSLSEERERHIGPTVCFPVTDVELEFSGYSEAERHAFLERFELIFRRGGG